MSLTIIILCPNGRRKNVKVSPNTAISQTLESFCDRESFDSSKLSFLFQRKILDETLSWRYANVPNNAKLELIELDKKRSETPVRIALQYEVTERVQHSFPPSTTLWDILSHWRSSLEGLTPAGHEPSILYMRQEICGIERLASTTLKSLGLTSGSAALRLFFKPVSKIPNERNLEVKSSGISKKLSPAYKRDDGGAVITQEMLQRALHTTLGPDAGPKSDGWPTDASETDTDRTDKFTLAQSTSDVLMETAMSSQSSSLSDFFETRAQNLNDEDMVEHRTEARNDRVRARKPGSAESVPQKKFKPTPPASPQEDIITDFKFPEETRGMDLYGALDQEDEDIDIRPLMEPCSRESIYYDENDVELVDEGEDPGDEFFDLTVDDIRKMLADLRSIQKESEEKMLVTARTREMERLRAINRYPKIVIRIVFPNRTVLQGIFRPAEPLRKLYDFVQRHLRDPRLEFYLYTAPPRVVLNKMKSILYDNQLAPASKVYFSLKNHVFHPKMITDSCIDGKGTTLEANASLQSVFDLKPFEKKSEAINGEKKKEFPVRARQETARRSDSPSTSQQATTPQRSNASGARPKVPKWFKLGHK